MDKRKRNVHAPWKRDENILLVNNLGDRSAFRPLAEPWQPLRLPELRERKARIAVGCFWDRDAWRSDNVPAAIFAHIGVHICGDAYVGAIDRASALKGAELILDGSQMGGQTGKTTNCCSGLVPSTTGAGWPAPTGTAPTRGSAA